MSMPTLTAERAYRAAFRFVAVLRPRAKLRVVDADARGGRNGPCGCDCGRKYTTRCSAPGLDGSR